MKHSLSQTTSSKTLAIILLSLWSGLAFYTLLSNLSGMLTMHHYEMNLWSDFRFMTFKIWLPWVFLTPLVIYLSHRFPVKPRRWLSAIIVHSTLMILLNLSSVLLISLHYHYFADMSPQMSTYQPWQHIGHFLFGDALFLYNTIIYTLLVTGFNIRNFSHLAQQEALLASELNSQLIQSKLHALKMQINPHFLFNTLNVISVLVMKAENDKANQMIGQLSRFFRQSLQENDQHLIPLEQELQHISQYLAIEKVRFGERLNVVENYQPQALLIPVPSMILQPLIENAMQHGLGEKEDPGTLTISCQCVRDELVICISDNGVGCNFNKAQGYREGVGLTNVRARLNQLYPNAHEFTLKNRPDGGVEVIIRLPASGDYAPQIKDNKNDD